MAPSSASSRRQRRFVAAAVACAALLLPLGVAAVESQQEEVHVENIMPLYASSLNPPYIDENLNSRWWNFGGDTVVDVNKEIRLTPDRQSKVGWLWAKIPLTSNSWVIEFEFKVHGVSSTLFGDGFAFWYTTEKEVVGPVFGSKDLFNGLGIFFDTYANGRARHLFPYVSVMIGDGKTKYDHDNDGAPNEAGGCPADFRSKDFPTKAKVKYVRDGYLQVQLNIKGSDVWEDCAIVQNVTLPTLGYLGFSAATGDVSDLHDIISINANGIVNADTDRFKKPENPDKSKKRASKRGGNSGSSSGWGAITWFFVLVGLCVVLYVAYVVYRQMNVKSNKRF